MNLVHMFENSDNIETYQSGDIIFSEGEPGDCLYVVLEGEVDIMLNDKVIDTASAGEIIGEMALIDAESRSATTKAKADSRLAPVDEKRFLFMVQQTPFFSLHVMRVLTARLRHSNIALAE